MKGTCGTCICWQPNISHKPEVFSGECHIRAPQVVTDAEGWASTVWPQTLHIDWCREHEPKPIDNPTEQQAPVSVGDYVLATKYADGDPADQWCIGFASEYLPSKKRWLVRDSNGNNFRFNGFRRAEKVTPEAGAEILRMMQAGACPDSIWTLRDAVQADIDNTTDTESVS